MEINEQHIELFDAYIFNRLGTDEKQNFEEKLLHDTAFTQDFEQYKILVLGIQDYGKAELKEFLKTQPKPEIKTVQLWRKPLAIAASLALLITIGYFAKNSFLPNTDKIAIKDLPKTEPTAPSKKDSVEPTITFLEIESEKKEEAIEMMPQKESDADIVPQVLDDEKGFATTEAPILSTTDDKLKDDYKVITEKKLNDTILVAYYLAYNDKLREKEDIEVATTKSNSYESKKKAIQTPASVNNKASTVLDNNNSNYNNDTIALKKLEKRKNQSITKYTVEFWQSPLNFKGYKFVGNTIQLYGLNEKGIKLFTLNNTTYLRANGAVYPLKTCADACMYKPETDAAIVNFILAQP